MTEILSIGKLLSLKTLSLSGNKLGDDGAVAISSAHCHVPELRLLELKGCLPNLQPCIDFVVMAFNADMRGGQVKLAATLRAAGYAVDVLLAPAKKAAKEAADGDEKGDEGDDDDGAP